ncbi:MAG: hypothetical protein AAF226_07495 [Verrucomicrobiota bacterium]
MRDPKKWGLYEYERRKSWEDELVSMYAECQSQKGLYRFGKALREEQQQAIGITEHLKSLRKRKHDHKLESDIRRSELRAQILTENVKKLHHLRELFYPSFGTFQPLAL